MFPFLRRILYLDTFVSPIILRRAACLLCRRNIGFFPRPLIWWFGFHHHSPPAAQMLCSNSSPRPVPPGICSFDISLAPIYTFSQSPVQLLKLFIQRDRCALQGSLLSAAPACSNREEPRRSSSKWVITWAVSIGKMVGHTRSLRHCGTSTPLWTCNYVAAFLESPKRLLKWREFYRSILRYHTQNPHFRN